MIRALQPVRLEQAPAPAEMEFFLPDFGWIRPHLLVRKFSRGIWLALLFLCLWMGRLTGTEALWDRAAVGMGFSLLIIGSLQGPPARLCAGEHSRDAMLPSQLPGYFGRVFLEAEAEGERMA